MERFKILYKLQLRILPFFYTLNDDKIMKPVRFCHNIKRNKFLQIETLSRLRFMTTSAVFCSVLSFIKMYHNFCRSRFPQKPESILFLRYWVCIIIDGSFFHICIVFPSTYSLESFKSNHVKLVLIKISYSLTT